MLLEAGLVDCAIDLPAEEVDAIRDHAPALRFARAGISGIGAIV
jgi:hypothetical protein